MKKTPVSCIDDNAAQFGMNGTKRILTGLILAVALMFLPRDATAGPPTRPMVSYQDPANGATGVALNKKIAVTFSEPMNPSTITASTFILKQGKRAVPGTVTYVGVTATFTPLGNLAPNTVYTARIKPGAKNLAGIAIGSSTKDFIWSFTTGTGSTPDTTAPTVSSTDPANAATAVAINKRIAATFSEPMDPATISAANFTLRQGATPVAGTVTYVGTTATFAPASALAVSTPYTATMTTGVKDLAGNALASNFVWSFTTGVAPDTTAPTVSSTDPANAATAVALNKLVAATFSEPMDPATISAANFTLQIGATPVAGTVTYAAVGATATFSPGIALAPATIYTATILTGVKDLAGNPLATAFSWSFTTGAAQDTNRPTVIATVPANAATGVATNQAINATFSESMDPLTISTANFLVTGPATPVTGTVAYDAVSKIATFRPVSALAVNTTYTATMTTGARDLAGNALGANFGWSFTTAATSAGQAPVVLGSATPFAVLAGSTVTSTGGTMVNGDLGLSPGTAVTGFPPGILNGTLHAADAVAAQAQLDLTTAYNDAAGRTVGAITLAGNLGGRTLTPGLYKSTSSLEISSGDLTLDAQGDANAVFIFQMGSTLTTTAGRQVILSGGARAANIFWQVGSSATLGTTSVMKGNILALASITLTTGATLEGRALARTAAVTLDANTITIPNSSAMLQRAAITQPAAILQSAALPAGPYTDAAGQSLDLATMTITVPLSGGMQFYRIRAGTALTITRITISGGYAVLTCN